MVRKETCPVCKGNKVVAVTVSTGARNIAPAPAAMALVTR